MHQDTLELPCVVLRTTTRFESQGYRHTLFPRERWVTHNNDYQLVLIYIQEPGGHWWERNLWVLV